MIVTEMSVPPQILDVSRRTRFIALRLVRSDNSISTVLDRALIAAETRRTSGCPDGRRPTWPRSHDLEPLLIGPIGNDHSR